MWEQYNFTYFRSNLLVLGVLEVLLLILEYFYYRFPYLSLGYFSKLMSFFFARF